MISNGGESTEETQNEFESDDELGTSKHGEHNRIQIQTIQTGTSDQRGRSGWFLDILKASSCKSWFNKLRFPSPFTIFQCNVDEREEMSLSVSSSVGIHHHFPIQFIRNLDLASLANIFMESMKNPKNIALLIWLVCVTISASMLGLLLIGLLNGAFPTDTSRNRWIEINNQVLNALFTLMSLYQHPKLFHHLVLLFRWRSEDIIELRKVYCKNGTYRPREWAHMLLVILLLHLTCFSQYALCGIYWGFTSARRPELAEDIFFALGMVAPVFASLYIVYSPLGRGFDSNSDEELQSRALEAIVSKSSKVVVSRPEWSGGLFDCREDMAVGCLSFFCTFCVFGWNMERLGFGNMHVHMVTFFLLCVAPFWIFSISALNISNDVIKDMVGIAGMVLCVFGLLYGGFWRIQMRKKFRLPGNSMCCGSDSMTDYVQWTFCWSCSLAQEVRTGNFYDYEEESFHRKEVESDEESTSFLRPLPREGGSSWGRFPNSAEIDKDSSSSVDKLQVSVLVVDDAMEPPLQPSIQSGYGCSDGNAVTPLLNVTLRSEILQL